DRHAKIQSLTAPCCASPGAAGTHPPRGAQYLLRDRKSQDHHCVRSPERSLVGVVDGKRIFGLSYRKRTVTRVVGSGGLLASRLWQRPVGGFLPCNLRQ